MTSDNSKAVASDALFGVWISVEDQLPPLREVVAAWKEGWIGPLTARRLHGRKGILWYVGDRPISNSAKPSHWIRFPNPPNPAVEGRREPTTDPKKG